MDMQISRIWTAVKPYFVTAVILWIVVAVGTQSGWGAFLDFILKAAFALLIVLALLGNAWAIPQLFVPMIAYLIWMRIASPFSFWRDILLLYLVILLFDWNGTERSARNNLARGLLAAVVAWIVLSGADLLSRQSASAPDPNRYQALREASTWKAKRIGIALSGGGYRAALVHAGVLDGLEKMKVAPTHISAISGGAIIGAYYAIAGRPEDFQQALVDNRFGMLRSATNAIHVAQMLVCPLELPFTSVKLIDRCNFGRSQLQANLLDRVLLSDTRMEALGGIDRFPKLIVGITEMEDGGQFGVTGDGIAYLEPPSARSRFQFSNIVDPPKRIGMLFPFEMPKSLKLSTIVAASGAFPGAFNPVAIEYFKPLPAFHAVDGGLTDNSGMNLLMLAATAQTPAWKLDFIIASDGSQPFGKNAKLPSEKSTSRLNVETITKQLNRTLDIVYNSVGEPPEGTSTSGPPKLMLSPALFLDRDGVTMDQEVVKRAMGEAKMLAQANPGLAYLVYEAWNEELTASLREANGKEEKVAFAKDGALGAMLRSLDTFVHASTLSDHYEEHEAKRLFYLGRMLVALNWKAIRAELIRPAAASVSPGTN